MSIAKTTGSRLADTRIDLGCIGRKRIHLAVFGCGQVGGRLIEQLLEARSHICEQKNIEFRIFAIANSRQLLLAEQIRSSNWSRELSGAEGPPAVDRVIAFAKKHKLENLIAIDNTASAEFTDSYAQLIRAGFNLVSSNKIANVRSQGFYDQLRQNLDRSRNLYLYETNVGAGLPLIDTLNLLRLSGEKVTRIRGVFSGSLSYIFNEFSNTQQIFSRVLKKAQSKGLTEPDSRLDLSGADVGRKLVILARELGIRCEFDQVSIENLIPADLRKLSVEQFDSRIDELNVGMHIRRKNLSRDQVLRYVADFQLGAVGESGFSLRAALQPVPKHSVLGGLKGSDTLFEIYTPNYQKHPLVIQGAGAGAEVTARGVLGDLLRIGQLIS